MDFRSIREAAFVSRFIHIVILGVIVALGVHYSSRTLIAVLTVAWFVVFAVVYLLVRKSRHPENRV